MFCQHCGNQLPDGAKFCGSCGRPVAQTEYKPADFPNSAQQPGSYTVPLQQETSQYTVPASHWENYNAQNQNPSYTAPVQQNSYTEPAIQTPSYQQQYQQPSYQPPSYQPPQSNVPVQPPEKKGGKKKWIIAAAVAVVALLLLMVATSGSKDKTEEPKQNIETEEKQEKPEQSRAASEAGVEKYANGAPRVDGSSFTFTMEEFHALYNAAFEKYDVPYSVFKEYDAKDNKHSFDLWNSERNSTGGLYLFLTEDPSTKRVTEITVSMYPEEGSDEYNTKLAAAFLCVMEVANGEMIEERIDELLEKDAIADFDGVSYKLYDFGTFANLTVKPCGNTSKSAGNDQKETPAPKNNSGALVKYPDGKLRFNKNGFLMGHEEFVELLQHALDANDVPFSFGTPIPVSGGKQNYPLQYQQEKVGYLIVTEVDGKVVSASVTYNIQDNEAMDDYGPEACLCLVESAHGAMTPEDWTYVADKAPLVTRDEYVIYIYELGGMKASMTVRADSFFMSVEPEE